MVPNGFECPPSRKKLTEWTLDGLTLVRQAVLKIVELSKALWVRVPHHPFNFF